MLACHIEHTKRAGIIVNANLAYSLTGRGHRFPIARLKPELNLVQLNTRLLTRAFWETANSRQRISEEFKPFHRRQRRFISVCV